MAPERAELGLGTARFGLEPSPFDRARVGEGEARAILETAAENRVRFVDTSAYFGEAERLLGRCWPFPSPFKVICRTLRLSDGGLDRLEARARRSVERLGLARAHALLIEDAGDLLGPEGRALWARLERLKEQGVFEQIGVSAHAEDAPEIIARRFRPDLMSVPCSLLDQRLVRDGTIERLAEAGVQVHLRHVFLQGLLFAPRDGLPSGLSEAGPRLSLIRRRLAEAGLDPMQAALAFALSRPGVTSAVVGVASPGELRAVLAAAARPVPDLDWSQFALDHPIALDPRRWPANDAAAA